MLQSTIKTPSSTYTPVYNFQCIGRTGEVTRLVQGLVAVKFGNSKINYRFNPQTLIKVGNGTLHTLARGKRGDRQTDRQTDRTETETVRDRKTEKIDTSIITI